VSVLRTTVLIGNSYSVIKCPSKELERDIQQFLSYTVGGSSAHFSGFQPRKKSLVSKRGEFPTGLLTRLLAHLLEEDVKFDVVDTRSVPTYSINFGYRGPKLRGYQIDAVKAFEQEGRGLISSSTGTGKSLIISGIIERMGLKTLIIVPNLELKKQLHETLLKVLTTMDNVVVENIDSNSLKNHKNFDLLIIDEAHHTASATYQKLNKTVWNGIYHRCFLTATPFRNDKEETLLFEAIAGDCVFEFDYWRGVTERAIVPVEAYYLDVERQQTNGYTYQQVYNELVVNNDHRNQLIGILLGRLKDKSTLCLVKEIAHGQILSELTGFPFVNGQDAESREYIRQFNDQKVKVLIGTTGVIGEGIDTKPCEYVIIASPGKAKSQFMQQIGRAVRNFGSGASAKESAKIIIFRDSSHKFLLRHYNAQKKILVDVYRTKPVKLLL
jgi:superfamily II DNA or RNA helicase